MKEKRPENLRQNILGIVLLIVGVAVAFAVFYRSNETRIARQNENYIEDIATQRARLISDLFQENISYIESSAIVIETEFQNHDVHPDRLNVEDESAIDQAEAIKVADILKTYEERFAFDYLRFIDLYGRDYTTGEKIIAAIVSEREYYQEGVKGKTGMTYILDSKVTSERQIGFYTPVRQGGEVVGIVVGFCGEDYIKELLNVSLFDHDCDVLLCDQNGTVIYSTAKADAASNFLDGLQDLTFAGEEDRQNVARAFSEGADALYGYEVDGQRTVGCVSYIGRTSDFFLVLSFPPDAYSQMVRNASINGAVLLFILIVLFLTAAVIYVVRFLVQKRRLLEETKNSNDIHFAMSRLFENFVIVDAHAGTYHYIEGMPEVGQIPNDGPYDLFAADLLKRFPGDSELREAKAMISFEHLTGLMNQGANIVSYNLHAPIRDEEWFTYNFIVVSRDAQGCVSEFIVARQDITKLQKKEEETRRILERARDEAEKGNRAKSTFLFSMSHDIRTPMNAIIGYTNIARDQIDNPELVRDSLNKIASSGQYLLSLINDVLDMSRIESGKVQLHENECDLGEVFARIADITHSQVNNKKLNVTFDVHDLAHPLVVVDELRLEQVLINITGNAVKYTPEGGCITIRATEEEAVDDDRRLYRFSVRDTGIGMSEEFLPKIFESFSRENTSTISKIQGTGLGMAITYRLVKLMGGDITVASKLNEGSEFVVTLQLPVRERTSAENNGDGSSPDSGVELKGRRILLVEDNDINAEIAGIVLESYGILPERASNGQEGLDMVMEKGDGYYDAVLMDIQMPVMNGYDATRAIRKLPGDYIRRLPIIAMSANAYEEDIRASLESGMNGHVAKPFDPQTLAMELHRHINGSAALK